MTMLPEPLFRWRCAILRALHRGRPLHAGDLWRFELGPDEPDARLLIYGVEPGTTGQSVFYVVPFTVWVPRLTNIQREHALFPMTELALRQSVTKRIGVATDTPAMEQDVDDIRELLRRNEVSLYDYPLRDAYAIYRLLEQRQID